MRLLCVNPNTTKAVTAKVAAALRPLLPPGTTLIEQTGRFGAPYITTRATYAIGGHAALDAFAAHADEPFDAVMLACFGDPAGAALRDVSAIPVIGMAEASCRVAARSEGAFSIVTGGHDWGDMLREFVDGIGLSGRLASVRTMAPTGGDAMRAPDAVMGDLLTEIQACVADGAARVILGGAGLAGLAERLRPLSPLPVIDCVETLAAVTVEIVSEAHSKGLSARPSPQAAALRDAGWLGPN